MNTNEETAVATAKREQRGTGRDLSRKFSPAFVEAETMFDKLAGLTQETAMKAYEFFQERGGDLGKEVQDWFNAESKVLRPVPVEISETDLSINVNAAVPGFKPEEIEISVKDDLLIMSGKTEKGEEREDDNLVYSDWESNQFFRKLTLPSVVDAENVQAELKDGILKLSLPKVAAQEAKSVAVKAG